MNRGKTCVIALAAIVTAVVLGACSQPPPTAVPTPIPTVAPPPPPTVTAAPAPTQAGPQATATAPAVDVTWERIKKDGKMIVGTSADYPPFEFLNARFQIDGFDPALIRAIGKQLGVEVQIKSFAFDGLYNGLLLGQVDAVIAAISITPARQQSIGFSNPYYVGEEAVLASDKSKINTIQSVDELAGYRIGVQDATVYETWLQENLVDTGKLPQRDLFSFTDTALAIQALKEGKIDLVVLDSGPAAAFVGDGGLKKVAGGLYPQYYGIGMPLEASTLRDNINKALATLQADGTVAQLQVQYLGFKPNPQAPTPVPQPTWTPRPVVVATPTPSQCIDGMAYVADLNYNDQNMTNPAVIQPGQPFKKGWRVQNSGTCTWTTGYTLVYAYGNSPLARMGGEPAAVMQAVPPGGTYDFYTNLVAPLQPGVFQGFWQMQNSAGQSFGQNVYVGIQVPAAPQPTPAPTQTPSAGITFTVDRTNVNSGQCVTFSWNVQNVKAVYFYPDGANWQNYGVAGQASSSQCPGQTTTYDLRVIRLDNSVEIRQITIYVQQTNAPQISYFGVNPQQIVPGQCVSVQWDVQGAVNKVTIWRGVGAGSVAIWDNAPTRGSMNDCPPNAGIVPYAIEAVGPGGTARQQRDVNVVAQPTTQPPTATPVAPPTPAPAPPIIDAFSVQPDHLESGQCVQIQWGTSAGTAWVRLTRNGTVVLDHGGTGGQLQDCLTEPINYIYRLEAFNGVGMSTAQERTTTVQVPPTPAPPQAPVIDRFDVSAKEIAVGQCVVLNWEFRNAPLARLSRSGQVLVPDGRSPGSHQDCPPGAGSFDYTLTIDSAQGPVSATQQVNVTEPMPGPLPEPPEPMPGAQPKS